MRRLLAIVRFFSPRLAQRLELEHKQRATRSTVYSGCRQVAEVFGAAKMAEDLGIDTTAIWSWEDVARQVASEYNAKAKGEAYQGTLDGLRAYDEQQDVRPGDETENVGIG